MVSPFKPVYAHASAWISRRQRERHCICLHNRPRGACRHEEECVGFVRYRTNVRGDAHTAQVIGAALNLIFSYVHPSKPQVTLGPFEAIWLTSAGMRTAPEGAIRAPYRNHQWEVDGLDYFRLDCTARVTVRFERGSERSSRYGAYERFSAVNGLAYSDDRGVAFLDNKVDEWLYYDTGYHWPVMV